MQIVDTFQSRLKKAMDLNNMKQVDLVNKTGLDKTLINKYLAGLMKAKQDKLTILADTLNVNEVWLMGYDIPMEKEYVIKNDVKFYGGNVNNKQAFPLLGKVRAGYNYLAQENIIGWITIDKKLADPENYFALKILGDSMQPVLYSDDIVIVHRQPDVESGQIAIVLVDDEEGTIKKVVKYDDHIELVAFNSYYPPRRLDKSNKFKILGKVVEARISKIFE